MTSFTIKLLAVIGMACVIMQSAIAGEIRWGNVSDKGPLNIFDVVVSKNGIPSLEQETEVEYPMARFNRFDFLLYLLKCQMLFSTEIRSPTSDFGHHKGY